MNAPVWIGLCECTCRILGSTSLKDKRRVLTSIKDKIRNRFNLSVAEVGHQDHWQLTKLAVAGVGSQQKIIERELHKASQILEWTSDLEIIDIQITFV